jgi:hypothetical protein
MEGRMPPQVLLVVIICLAFRESDRDDQREELVVVLADAIKQAASSEHVRSEELKATKRQ